MAGPRASVLHRLIPRRNRAPFHRAQEPQAAEVLRSRPVGDLLCVSDCTSCSIVAPDSSSPLLDPLSGSPAVSPVPATARELRRRKSFERGFERAISAIRESSLGPLCDLVSCSAQDSACCVHSDAARARRRGAVLDQRDAQQIGLPKALRSEIHSLLVRRTKRLRLPDRAARHRGNRLDRDVVNSRRPARRRVQQGQLAAVSLGKLPPRNATPALRS